MDPFDNFLQQAFCENEVGSLDVSMMFEQSNPDGLATVDGRNLAPLRAPCSSAISMSKGIPDGAFIHRSIA